MARYYYEIGSDSSAMKNLEDDLGLMPPYQDPVIPGTSDQEGADGLVYQHGWGQTGWRWGFISTADRAELRNYCPSRSAAVTVRTRNENGAWYYYNAIMVWPQENSIPVSDKILDFAVTLRLTENLGTQV